MSDFNWFFVGTFVGMAATFAVFWIVSVTTNPNDDDDSFNSQKG